MESALFGAILHRKEQSRRREFYELDRCERWIKTHQLKRVALQFPDELLVDSAKVAEYLKDATLADVFILGDTSYGSCCVDEVAAQHYSSDSIIHYGRSCLSPTDRLPVLFVFGKGSINVQDCIQKIASLFADTKPKLILMYDVIFYHAAENILAGLHEKFADVICSKLQIPADYGKNSTKEHSEKDGDNVDTLETICRCRRKVDIPKESQLEQYAVLYIGKESLTLTNLLMNFNRCQFYTYDPEDRTVRKETVNVNKALMKRYYMIERAKDARIVGIVVGTLGVTDYLQALNRMKELLKKAGKKTYTFVVGKLNVAKLANFMEVDVFVLLACTESTLIDSSEFYKPVVTPMEMEVACNTNREWTGEYYTDFRQLLPGGSDHVEIPAEISQEDRYDVSLITGNLRHLGEAENEENTSSAVLPREEALHVAVSNTAADFLSGRQWKGLERKLGETPVSKAVIGQSGIAASYENETPHYSS
ncbi:2-(3-amino-3-carboxypropyl)histidine synthase subunit 2-like [Liolophura sinensis]|uniref:2-(3-amino-3-carboxypropyl)histidine synthase subunit 2-like n=1 Tax=Liolophura sinensis TaxID=3198878 RepID=UPI0031588937